MGLSSDVDYCIYAKVSSIHNEIEKGGGGWGEGAVLPNGLGCWFYSRGLIQALYHVTSETGVQQLCHALS